MTSIRDTFFFVHVMKTGGTTFVQHINANFAPDEIFPDAEHGEARRRAYTMIDALRELPAERKRAIRVYTGHFPYVASTFVEPAPMTFTILREPVERTVSVLRHVKRHQPRLQGATLEAIYDDGFVFPMQIHNYQVKQFALTRDDRLKSHFDIIEIDDARLDIARANLERVDVLGLHSDYDAFVDEFRRRFGWNCSPVPNLRVYPDTWEATPELRERIIADNAADIAFYAHARELYAHPGGSGRREA